MNYSTFAFLTAALLVGHSAPAAVTVVVSYDDGFAETAFGVSSTNNTIWLNAFQAQQNLEVLAIDIAFGPDPGDAAPVQAYLWTDPTNDGDPIDAMLVETVSGVTSGANFNPSDPLNFTRFNFSPQFVGLGDYYFLGFQTTGFALVDTSNTVPVSYVFSDFSIAPTDPSDLGAAAGGGRVVDLSVPPGVLTIRSVVAVPELSTYLAIISATGLVGFVYYRRRRDQKKLED